ncbi:transmembrane protein 138-like isoform X2 [Xenia sp. Carnegie-2017]|uniref:transmembrane protein 138-like isoform X2 n=1 Tax=Xenia sp. Carnegie-2017 TaxID=2897299 RepID=UPI001F03FE4D|nr:transmembrane protein 138-like isoform X2 [Xenia sp. Carnegie-2017]
MRVSRYRPVVYLQLLFLFFDIFINSFGDLFRTEDVILLVLYIIQDVCILFALIVVFLVFFNTYIFQAGLVFLLIRKFKTTITITVFYLFLSLGLHVWTMTRKWGDPQKYIWDGGYQVVYVIQRLGSVLYYYYYKRTCLKLGDPRYYQESQWLRNEFARLH